MRKKTSEVKLQQTPKGSDPNETGVETSGAVAIWARGGRGGGRNEGMDEWHNFYL